MEQQKVIVKNGHFMNVKPIIITTGEKKDIYNAITKELKYFSPNDLYYRRLINIQNKFK